MPLRLLSHRRPDESTCGSILQIWTKQILEAFQVNGPVTMIGYSYGAYLSASVALKAPEVVDKLVLIAPAAVFAPVSMSFIFRAIFHTVVYSGLSGFAFENWLSATPGFDYGQDMERMHVDFLRASKRASPRATILTSQPYQFSKDELEVVASHPTLVIWGSLEKVFDPATARSSVQSVSGIALREYPKSGHLLLIEEPRLQAEKEVVDFVTQS